MNNNVSKFIAFEGIDGSGKSTQLKMLISKLRENNIKYYATCEPTDGPIGSLIHQFMSHRMITDDRVIAGLFVADRLDHLLNKTNGICEKLKAGISVITDRYYFSSYAYHGVYIPMEWVIEANRLSADILRPTLNIYIDIDPEIALKRVLSERGHIELYEKLDNLIKVREKYFEAFDKLQNVENIVVIDGNRAVEDVFNDIWKNVKDYFIEI